MMFVYKTVHEVVCRRRDELEKQLAEAREDFRAERKQSIENQDCATGRIFELQRIIEALISEDWRIVEQARKNWLESNKRYYTGPRKITSPS